MLLSKILLKIQRLGQIYIFQTNDVYAYTVVKILFELINDNLKSKISIEVIGKNSFYNYQVNLYK